MADMKDVAQIVGMISAAYPNFNPTELTIEVYFRVLQDIETDELKQAVLQCVAEDGRKFAPSVGEIRGAVLGLRRASMNIPSSYDAWEEVQRQIRVNGGDFGVPVWSNPLVEKVVKSLGWYNLRMSENQISDRARFIEAYEQLTARAEKEMMLIPEVRAYLEDHGARLLDSSDKIKQLTERLEK